MSIELNSQRELKLARHGLLAAYGVAIGVAYASVLTALLSTTPLFGIVLAVLLGAAFGVFGFTFSHKRDSTLTQDILLVPLAPFALAAGLFGIACFLCMVAAMMPFIMLRQAWEARNLRKALALRGRYLSFPELHDRLVTGQGTLIEETAGKGPFRIWWTEDDLLSLGTPVKDPDEFVGVLYGERDHPFNARCVAEYLDEIKGKAFLTSIAPREVTSGKLLKQFPKTNRVTVIRPMLIEAPPKPSGDAA